MQELAAETTGDRLRHAREAAGQQRADIAARTRISERHLAALEDGRYADLPGRTYAFGFARTYARALGMDEDAVVGGLRREMGVAEAQPLPEAPAFEPGDPARVPSARFAWMAGLLAVILALAGGVWWKLYYEPAAGLPSILPESSPSSAAPAAARPAAIAAPAPAAAASTGPVVFTSLRDGIWVKFYDAAGKQLMQKQMAKGETYTVPADASGPQLWTGRPDALAITVGGKPVPPLATQQKIMKGVPVTAAALLARPATPAPAPVAAGRPVTALVPARPAVRRRRPAPVEATNSAAEPAAPPAEAASQ